MNHFIPAEAITEGKCVMLDRQGELVFAGPLAAVTETHFNQATKTFVHPRTLEWIKQKADEAIKTGRYRV